MNEERAAEGVDHLQAAALELIGAARAFLDVVEEAIDADPRLAAAAEAVGAVVVGAARAVRGDDGPWPSHGATSGTPTTEPASGGQAGEARTGGRTTGSGTTNGVEHIEVS